MNPNRKKQEENLVEEHKMSDEEKTLGMILGDLVRLHHTRIHKVFADIGLHRGQPPILFMLWHKDGVTQKEISERLNLAPATITDALQRMEKAQLLERRSDKEDLRVTRVYITQKGRDSKVTIDEAFKAFDEDCFKGFTLEEKILLRRFFLQIRDNLL